MDCLAQSRSTQLKHVNKNSFGLVLMSDVEIDRFIFSVVG